MLCSTPAIRSVMLWQNSVGSTHRSCQVELGAGSSQQSLYLKVIG